LVGKRLPGENGGYDKMAKKNQSAAVPVKDAMFFPQDFAKLHRRHVIYIRQGVIIDLDRL
jgi:hypothetical protein